MTKEKTLDRQTEIRIPTELHKAFKKKYGNEEGMSQRVREIAMERITGAVLTKKQIVEMYPGKASGKRLLVRFYREEWDALYSIYGRLAPRVIRGQILKEMVGKVTTV